MKDERSWKMGNQILIRFLKKVDLLPAEFYIENSTPTAPLFDMRNSVGFFMGRLMQYVKPPLTFQQQADLLLSRGLQADKSELILRLKLLPQVNGTPGLGIFLI